MSQDDTTRSIYKDRIAEYVAAPSWMYNASKLVKDLEKEVEATSVPNVGPGQKHSPAASEPTEGGMKADEGKCRLDLIPWPAVWAIANVREFGAIKYEAWDWEKGIEFTRLLGAALRHLTKYLQGEDVDPESGQSHVAHAMTGLAFLQTYIMQGKTDLDDRYKYQCPMTRDLPITPKKAFQGK